MVAVPYTHQLHNAIKILLPSVLAQGIYVVRYSVCMYIVKCVYVCMYICVYVLYVCMAIYPAACAGIGR